MNEFDCAEFSIDIEDDGFVSEMLSDKVVPSGSKDQFLKCDDTYSEYTEFLPSSLKEVSFIQADENAKLPFKASEKAACGDLFSVEDVTIYPGKTKLVNTGLQVANIPEGYKLEIYDRSGYGAKSILLGNSVGQIDADYRGLLKVILHNASEIPLEIKIGDRCAQIALEEVIPVSYKFTDTFVDTARGSGGFGSTN